MKQVMATDSASIRIGFRFGRSYALVGSCLAVWFALNLLVSSIRAEDYRNDFDGIATSWQIRNSLGVVKPLVQERRRDAGRQLGAEFLRLRVLRDDTSMLLEHDVPPARILDELEASLWVHSDQPGFTLAMRIGFRGVNDPETGRPITLVVTGDVYTKPGEWQRLTCRSTDKKVDDQLRQLRAKQLSRRMAIQPELMFLQRIVLGCKSNQGTIDLRTDDLSLGPLVVIDKEISPSGTTSRDSDSAPEADRANSVLPNVPVEFRMHRLRVEGRPFFPRIVAHRGERPEPLADAGFNTAWVEEPDNPSTGGALRRRGLWLTAIPPFAKGADGEPLDSEDASLLPFGSSSNGVLFWTLGARMTALDRPRLSSWSTQIKDADRTAKRPLSADVAEDERYCSRYLDMLGLSRHVVNTSCPFVEARDSLIQRRDMGWPGAFCWTWIQTEPAPELMSLERAANSIPVVEPEQIRAQVYSALSAGFRGIGYWTTTRLDDKTPQARERLLTLTQLNLELSLLEPMLATGSSLERIAVAVEETLRENPIPETTTKPQGNAPFPVARSKSARSKSPILVQRALQRDRELSATLIRSEHGALLLPMWLEENSQYVPGRMAALNATIIVPGGGETASAWEITTTGHVRNLNRETGARGLKIVLPQLDQTAAILITSDMRLIEYFNSRVDAIAPHSAQVCTELSRLKLARVSEINSQLQQLRVCDPDSNRLLAEAASEQQRAELALGGKQFREAQRHAGVAMQWMRLAQRINWERAVKGMASPVASPFAVSYQTLPAHWKLLGDVARSGNDRLENRLPSGEFEDLDTMLATGWRHEQRSVAGIRATAEMQSGGRQGRFSLRLSARQTDSQTTFVSANQPLVSLTSPPLTVHAGQVIKITGWFRVPTSSGPATDMASISDNLLGKTGTLRLTATDQWQSFELLRVVPESRDFQITLALNSLGEASFDDIQVRVMTPTSDVAELPRRSNEVQPARFADDSSAKSSPSGSGSIPNDPARRGLSDRD